MSEIFAIIPENVPPGIRALIFRHCPLSQAEIVDDKEHVIYKYVGMFTQPELKQYIPGDYIRHNYREGVVSLYEDPNNNVVVFWHENVLVVMVSNTEEQHDGVMNHYGDAAILLTQIGNSRLIAPLLREK